MSGRCGPAGGADGFLRIELAYGSEQPLVAACPLSPHLRTQALTITFGASSEVGGAHVPSKAGDRREALTPVCEVVMLSHILQDLFQRRVPHFLAVYLAVGWGVLEFCGFLVDRYELSPYLVDIALVALLSMVPTVLMLAYFHGGRGPQEWTRVEKIGVPANLIATATVLVFAFSGKDLSGTASTTEYPGYPVLEPTRIAVLYFDDESEAQNLEHLARAFTSALIDKLSQVDALDVLPRSSVKPYVKAPVSLDSLVRALGMGTLVEGSVSGSSEHLAVSVSVIDPVSQSVLEHFSLDGRIEEWVDVRSELAGEVARVLRRRLGDEIRLREQEVQTRSAEALALVRESEKLTAGIWRHVEAGDTGTALRELAEADSLLARAESLDPSWVEPVVQRGWIALRRPSLAGGVLPSKSQEDLAEGLGCAERALKMNPEHAGALELRGSIRQQMVGAYGGEGSADIIDQAEKDLLAAIAQDPLRAGAWQRLSTLYRVNARFQEAKQAAERALEADPFLRNAATVTFRLYETSLELKDMGEAIRWCEEGRRRFPNSYSFVSCSLFTLALPLGPEPDVEQAWALLDTMLSLASQGSRDELQAMGRMWVAAVLARAGHADSAVAVSEGARALAGERLRPWLDYYYAAYVRLLLGQRDDALALLESFLEAVPQRKAYIAKDWMFEELWSNPRFQALVSAE